MLLKTDSITTNVRNVAAIDIETDDPLLDMEGNGALKRVGRILTVAVYCPDYGLEGYWTWDDFINDDEAVACLADPDIIKVFHNGLYDLNWLVEWGGLKVEGRIDDTLTREMLLDQHQFSYKLDDCCIRRNVLGKNKADTIDAWWTEHGGKGKAIIHLKDIPVSIVGKYNAQDAKATYDLYQVQQPLLHEQNLEAVNELECGQIPWVMKCRHTGIRIDSAARRQLSKALNTEYEQCWSDFVRKYGNVNTRSYIEMEQLFIKLGLPIVRSAAGRASFTADVLGELEHPIGHEILHLRMLEKAINTYVDGNFVDLTYKGRLYPELIPTKRDDGGAITGRYACRNPNLQAVSAREEKHGTEMRSLFVPDEGCLIGAFDYKQIEYRVFAHFAVGEAGKEIQKAYQERDIDFHQFVQDMMGWTTGDKKKDKGFRHITKCLGVGSYIATEDGYVPTQDLAGHKLLGHDHWLSKVEKQPALRLTLSNGQQYVVTPEHPFPLLNKAAKELCVGDEFPVVPCQKFGDYVVEKLKPNRRHRNPVLKVDEATAYLLGLYLGDGSMHWVKGVPSFISFCTHPAITKEVQQIAGQATTSRVSDNWVQWEFCSRVFAVWVAENCGYKKEKRVPDVIYRSPASVIKSFVAGFLDSDGTINGGRMVLMNTNERLLRGMARCLAMLGWPAAWSAERYNTECYRNQYEGVLYRLSLYRGPAVDVPAKLRKFDNRSDRPQIKPVRVTGIEDVGEQDVFVLTTDGNHEYQAECTVHHNCLDFGVLYGLGKRSFATKFRDMLLMTHPNVPETELVALAAELIQEQRDKIPFIVPTINAIKQVAERRGYVVTVGGRRQRKQPDGKRIYAMVNYLCQGSAGDIVKKAIWDSWKAGVWDVLHPHLMVHDELVFSIPQTREGYEACLKLKDCMVNAYKLHVPLGVDMEIGPDWGHCNEENWKAFAARFA